MTTDVQETRVVAPSGPSNGPGFTWTFALRLVLTLGGAACFLVAAFAPWINELHGNDISARFFYSTDIHQPANFLVSGSMVAVVLGVLALLGLAAASGWPTRLAGALGVVAFALLVIELYRSPSYNPPADIGLGIWLFLAGGILCLIGGVVGTVVSKDASRTIVVD